MAVKVGGATGGGNTKKNFKIKDGDNVYRILPSLGFDGKEPNGKWSKFYRIHFGYKNSEGKMRVFESSLVKNKEKMITSPDAALERLEKFKAELEKAKASGNKAMVDKLTPLVSTQKPLYNLDSNHHMNAVNENGEIGVLKLRHKGKLALDAVIKQLRNKGIEPLGAETGRFFVINRTGTGPETVYTVSVKTKTINVASVGDVEQPVVHVLTSDILVRLESEAADLDNLYAKPTSDDVAKIVTESDPLTGISPNIEAILKKSAPTTVATAEDTDGPDTEELPSISTTAAPSSAGAPLGSPLVAATTTPLAQPQSLSKPAVQVQATVTPKPAAAASTEMSDEEFLKSLGA